MNTSPWSILGASKEVKVLLLGTFHFNDSMLSENRQTEIKEVVDLLAQFKPAKIAVENRPETEHELNQRYSDYIAGQRTLGAGEIAQIAFRLAKQLNHNQLYGIDAWGQIWEEETWETTLKYLRERFGTEDLFDPFWGEAYSRLYSYDDKLLQNQTLREHLLYDNSEERILAGHGHYLSWVDATEHGDYTITDHITGWWYNRNLRIFANIKKIAKPDDRIIVLIGSGHIPILRHCVQSSPLLDLVEVADVLR
jgi:hypothetical protein